MVAASVVQVMLAAADLVVLRRVHDDGGYSPSRFPVQMCAGLWLLV